VKNDAAKGLRSRGKQKNSSYANNQHYNFTTPHRLFPPKGQFFVNQTAFNFSPFYPKSRKVSRKGREWKRSKTLLPLIGYSRLFNCLTTEPEKGDRKNCGKNEISPNVTPDTNFSSIFFFSFLKKV